MAGTLGTAILGNTLLDVLSTQDCNVATFGNQSSNLLIRLYDSNLPFADKNYIIGLCNIDNTYQHNALYISANQSNMTRIGIGTAFPASIMEIDGVDAVRVPYGSTLERPTVAKKGQIRYNTELDYFEGYGTGGFWAPIGSGGGGSTWAVVTSNVPGFVLSSGTFNTSCNVVLKRSGNNDVALQMYIKGDVAVKPTGGADYRINLPVALDTESYPVSMILGEMWLLTSNTTNGAVAEYKALAKSIPGDAAFITMKYLNGTTETSLGEFNVGMNLTLHGLISYKAAVIYNPPSFNSNNVLMTGANVTWTNSLYPYPYLTAPTGGALTMTYRQGSYRYFGDDIIHNVYIQATLDTQPGDVSLNHTLGLEWPVNLTRYTSNTIVGDLWVKVTNGSTFTSYKAYAQTNVADSNVVTLRYVNGTYDLSLASIAAGSAITIQGTMTYKTMLYSSLFIPTQYLPNKLYQDGDGRVALNNDGAVVRARWEVIETSNTPAMIIDQRSEADVLQFRSNETNIITIINAKGNVGIGTSMAPHPMTVWGGMMFNGTMYDTYGNPLWIPGSSVDWKPTPSLPVIGVPTGGTWVQQNALTKGLWRYIGNEVSYNVAVTGTMTVAPTDVAANFALSLPAPVKLSAYTDTPTTSNVILGELWANIASGANSNMFKAFAMVDATNSNQVALRVLSGTTDTSFSAMSAPSTLTIRGEIHYTTTSNILAISVPSTAIPVNFTKDQQGRVALNSANPPRAQLDIVMSNESPALIVDQQSSADIVQFMKSGVVVGGVDANANITTTGSISAGNMSMFRNRIINGDMRIDQRGGGGTVGAGAGSSSAGMTTTYSLDRWAIATGPASGTLCAAQTTLNATDQAAVGGVFTNAAVVGVAPLIGMYAYYPFESNVLDMSGNGYNLTVTGSVSYVPGRVGSNAVYLANEANIVATPTKASNRLSMDYDTSLPSTFCFWMCLTKMPVSGMSSTIFNIGIYTSSTPADFVLRATYVSTITATVTAISGSGGVAFTANINTFYHITIIFISSTSITLYLNGVYQNIYTTSISSGGKNRTLVFGDYSNPTDIQPFAGFIDDFRIYNRVLSATEIAALAGIAPIQVAPATTVASGLTTRLTFDNTTADAQGTLGAPTVTGTTVYSSLSKSGTRSLDLTANTAGSSTITTALSYAYTNNTLPISIAFWFNTPSILTDQVPIMIGNPNTNFSIQIVLRNAEMYIDVKLNSGTTYTNVNNKVAFLANTWYHFVSIVELNKYVLLYVNGIQRVTSSVVLPSTGNLGTVTALRIGSQYTNATAFKGYIDDVRIYNRALSPQEVAGLYYSYQPSPYVLYQQPIEGLNVADLGWGTTAAQSATVSAWIKNNTASAQQFSLSAGNAGTIVSGGGITAITFETGIEDTLGYLTNPVGTNVVYSTSIYKVGTRALDLTANTAASSTVLSGVVYNLSSPINLPLSVSFWAYTNNPTAGNFQVPISFGGSSLTTSSFSFEFVFGTTGLYVLCCINNAIYQTNGTPITTTANTWTHLSMTAIIGGRLILFVNGIEKASIALPVSGTLSQYGGTGPITTFALGQEVSTTKWAYKGYIDDVRIYNKALSANDVYQIYTTNVSSTTISQFLLPRSYLYTTPSIPANTWQKISFTIPGDTTDAAWAKDNRCGLNLALCLGAGGVYVSSGTSGWASAEYVTGSNIQVFGGSATNFLNDIANSIYITGVQLERGTLMTPFEFRPSTVELQLCQRYYQQYTLYYLGLAYSGVFGYSHGLPLKQIMRAIPSLQSGATFTVNSGSSGTPVIYTATTEVVTVWNPTSNWTATAELRFTGGFNAEL